jgi:hypothetical protein
MVPINYDRFDPEVVELCRALNDLPGIATTNSCCGHGKSPFCIFFDPDPKDRRGLFILARCVDHRYFEFGHQWSIRLSVGDFPLFPLPIVYRLESEAVGEEAYTQAQAIVATTSLLRGLEEGFVLIVRKK